MGFNIPTTSRNDGELAAAVNTLLAENPHLGYCVVSENSRGDRTDLAPDDLKVALSPEPVRWLLPQGNVWQRSGSNRGNQGEKYLGHGYRGILATMDSMGEAHPRIRGTITNESNHDYIAPRFALLFGNATHQVLCVEIFKVDRLPPGETKPFETWVESRDVLNYSKIELVCIGEEGAMQGL